MENSKKYKYSSIIRYLPIVLADILWIYIFFKAYVSRWDVSIVFFPSMIVVWYVFNFISLFVMSLFSDNIEVAGNSSIIEKDSTINKYLRFLVPKFKYLVIIYINYFLIRTLISGYMEYRSFTYIDIFMFLIYNLPCLFFILVFRKSKDREFYYFVLIVLPVIIWDVWLFIA